METSATSTKQKLAINSNQNDENHDTPAQNPPKTCARPQKNKKAGYAKKLATHSPDRSSDVKVVFHSNASESEVTPASPI